MYNYSVEFTPTKSPAGGTLLYINNKLSYKLSFVFISQVS